MTTNTPAELRSAAVKIERIGASLRQETDRHACRTAASQLYNRAAKAEKEPECK